MIAKLQRHKLMVFPQIENCWCGLRVLWNKLFLLANFSDFNVFLLLLVKRTHRVQCAAVQMKMTPQKCVGICLIKRCTFPHETWDVHMFHLTKKRLISNKWTGLLNLNDRQPYVFIFYTHTKQTLILWTIVNRTKYKCSTAARVSKND